MTGEEQAIWDDAIRFSRSNKKAIGKRLTDQTKYPPKKNLFRFSWRGRRARVKQKHL